MYSVETDITIHPNSGRDFDYPSLKRFRTAIQAVGFSKRLFATALDARGNDLESVSIRVVDSSGALLSRDSFTLIKGKPYVFTELIVESFNARLVRACLRMLDRPLRQVVARLKSSNQLAIPEASLGLDTFSANFEKADQAIAEEEATLLAA